MISSTNSDKFSFLSIKSVALTSASSLVLLITRFMYSTFLIHVSIISLDLASSICSLNKGNRVSDDIARLIDNGIESIYYLGELNDICFQYDRKEEDKALINDLFKEFVIRYLKDLESLYVNVSRILLEYIIKFRFAHAIANSLIEVVKNHDCLNTCSGSIDDLVRCFRRNRRGIKSTSLARAFSYFEEDLKISLSEEAKQELKQSLAMRIRFTPSNNSAIRVTTTITTYVVLK